MYTFYRLQESQLFFKESINFNEFYPSSATPVTINSFSDDSSYNDLTALYQNQPSDPILYQPTQNWHSLLRKQPQWIRHLLDEIQFTSRIPNPSEIISLHNRFGRLLTVSDGSVKFHNMSFGWILATPDGTIIAYGAGPCNGRGNSLRSEGAGMLAVTVLISLISILTSTDNIKLTCVSDNQELINRMNCHKDYEYPFPNETTRSEFDITEQIYRTSQIHRIKANYEWVRSHQDDNAPIEDLSIHARLNVHADHLAGDYQLRKGKFRPLVHIMPSCPAMVSIRNISVTSNIFKHLVKAYVEPRYIGYLQDKYNWNNSVTSIISWKSLTLAIERIDRGVLLTKICHAILPTNRELKKQQYIHNDQCPLCSQSESFKHLIQCQHQSRTQWRCAWICKTT